MPSVCSPKEPKKHTPEANRNPKGRCQRMLARMNVEKHYVHGSQEFPIARDGEEDTTWKRYDYPPLGKSQDGVRRKLSGKYSGKTRIVYLTFVTFHPKLQ